MNNVTGNTVENNDPRSVLDTAWVIIPAYNEGAMISEVIENVLLTFKNVVVIDDCSTDDTADYALAAGAHVISHPVNLGQGASLQTGFDYVKMQKGATCVVTFDADGQHSVEDARGMVELLDKEHLDAVIGSRFLDGKTQVAPLKKIILKTAAAWGSRSTGMKLTDAHNGLRVLSMDTVRKIQITQNRMAHASEIIDELADLKVKYKEYANHIKYTDYSKAKGQPLLNSVNILIEMMMK